MVDIERMIAVAQAAGDLILSMQQAGLRNVRGKASAVDLVTEADVASEGLIRSALAEAYPEVGFWGEESNTPPQTSAFWVVDPIDGTTNFANGLPLFAVNIAYCQGDAPHAAVTLALPARRVYYATLGAGAYLRAPDGQERRLAVNQVVDLSGALLTTGFPYSRAEHADNNLTEHAYFTAHAQAVRCMGSAALDLAHVAAGYFAGYWEAWLKPWDAAAGALLVTEAGGKVTDYWGRPWALRRPTLVASNGQPALHDALITGIHKARASLSARLLVEPDGAAA